MLGKERASRGTVYIPSPGAAILYEQRKIRYVNQSLRRVGAFVVGEDTCCILCDVEPRAQALTKMLARGIDRHDEQAGCAVHARSL